MDGAVSLMSHSVAEQRSFFGSECPVEPHGLPPAPSKMAAWHSIAIACSVMLSVFKTNPVSFPLFEEHLEVAKLLSGIQAQQRRARASPLLVAGIVGSLHLAFNSNQGCHDPSCHRIEPVSQSEKRLHTVYCILHYTMLHNIISYYIILCHTILYYIYYIILYYIILHYI